jgi:hypothetical protein
MYRSLELCQRARGRKETMKVIVQSAAALIAVAAAWLTPQTASACKCLRLEPAAAAEQASAVFEGRVVEVADVANAPAQRRQVTFRVVRVWKGMQSEQAVLTTASESAACGIDFVRDQNYVVYASKDGDALTANSCSRTRVLADADDDIKVLGMGWTPVDPNAGPKDSKPSKAETKATEEPPARGGCASCSLASPRNAPTAFALLLPALWLIVRRARSRAAP